MKILITGATGFLGRHLMARLEDSDHEVVGFARSKPSNAQHRYVQGDVLDRASLDAAMQGVNVLVHAAGRVSHEAREASRCWELHVRGTRNAMESASAAGVARVVYLSTSGTVAVSKTPVVHDERGKSVLELVQTWPYYRSKLFAEQEALRHNRPEMPVISLNPSLLLGPGDTSHESTRAVMLFLQGKLTATPSGGVSFVDVRDVAEAVISAFTAGKGGERYLLGAVNWSWVEFYDQLANVTGMKAPPFALPSFTNRLLGWLPELGRDGGSGFGSISRAELEIAGHFWYLDPRRAAADLAWEARDPLTTLLDTVRGC